MALNITHTSIPTHGISLHVAQAGPEDGPLVVLLHGFPEFWYGWRRQLPFLAGAGFRAWAPDQRGYNLSDKPAGVAAYGIEELARDVVGLIDASGRERVCLVGHDWGGAVAWWVAGHWPERVDRLAILNMPHPRVMAGSLRHSLAQLRRSWYIFFFQIPRLPEAALGWGNARNAARLLRAASRPGTFSDAELAEYRRAWTQPGALRGMIHWYRAAARGPSKLAAVGRIRVPVLMIWGTHDIALGREMAQPSIAKCDDGLLVYVEEAGHFVQHEEPERVNALLGQFLKA